MGDQQERLPAEQLRGEGLKLLTPTTLPERDAD